MISNNFYCRVNDLIEMMSNRVLFEFINSIVAQLKTHWKFFKENNGKTEGDASNVMVLPNMDCQTPAQTNSSLEFHSQPRV